MHLGILSKLFHNVTKLRMAQITETFGHAANVVQKALWLKKKKKKNCRIISNAGQKFLAVRDMPFQDNSFYLVVFDPPHLVRAGEKSWLAMKYGTLPKTWQEDLRQGFDECMRVLKPHGTLVFKWNEDQIQLNEILKSIDYEPLFGNKRGHTYWLVFLKE